jgi:hypothetical protein
VCVATATPAPARAVLPDAVSVEPLPARDAPAPLLACIDRCAPDVVVTDAYLVATVGVLRISILLSAMSVRAKSRSD